MKNCYINKENRKWIVRNENAEVLYTANTRVACFRWAAANEYRVAAYGHGEK